MIKYRDGYDGQLAETVTFQLPITLCPFASIESEFLDLTETGQLTIKAGYAWDYASVPVTHKFSNWFQGDKSKVPSLIHDALCQLIRQKLLTVVDARLHADKHFYELLRERKFGRVRAWVWYRGVRIGAKMNEQKPKPILEAL